MAAAYPLVQISPKRRNARFVYDTSPFFGYGLAKLRKLHAKELAMDHLPLSVSFKLRRRMYTTYRCAGVLLSTIDEANTMQTITFGGRCTPTTPMLASLESTNSNVTNVYHHNNRTPHYPSLLALVNKKRLVFFAILVSCSARTTRFGAYQTRYQSSALKSTFQPTR